MDRACGMEKDWRKKMKMILKDWKSKFHFGFDAEGFPGPLGVNGIIIFIMILPAYLRGKAEKEVIYGLISVFFLNLTVRLNQLFGIRFSTIYYLLPLQKEQKDGLVKKNYWARVIVFTVSSLPVMIVGKILFTMNWICLFSLFFTILSLHLCEGLRIGTGWKELCGFSHVIVFFFSLFFVLIITDISTDHDFSKSGWILLLLYGGIQLIATIRILWVKYRLCTKWHGYEEEEI